MININAFSKPDKMPKTLLTSPEFEELRHALYNKYKMLFNIFVDALVGSFILITFVIIFEIIFYLKKNYNC